MNSLLRNPEYKSITIKLLITQLILAGLTFFFTSHQTMSFNKAIAQENIALVGKILTKHPELEGEIIGLITKGAKPVEVKTGQELLIQYGYSPEKAVYSQPLLSKFYYHFGINNTLLILLYSIPIFLLISVEYQGIYTKIKVISQASEKVIDGDFTIQLPESREGEFDVLGHHFNQMANRLKLSLERLQQEKMFFKDILSDISHQIKTPLSSLIMFNELLLRDEAISENTRKDFLLKSQSQLDRMEWLIINLLKIARLEAGAIKFEDRSILLKDSLDIALTSLGTKIKEKGLKLIVTGDLEKVYFRGDKEWMGEALINIIKNSLEHTRPEGQILIHLRESPLFSQITIKDNGEGISKKDLPHIFERFYRGSNSVKANSVGIGLALARLIVEGQYGTITVQSLQGEGTEFVITFPKGII